MYETHDIQLCNIELMCQFVVLVIRKTIEIKQPSSLLVFI